MQKYICTLVLLYCSYKLPCVSVTYITSFFPTGTPLILFAILSVEMQRKCDELRSDNERLDSDIAQALTKIDQLEERAKNQEEEGQHREDAFASELSETKELLQEMKQSVKVKKNHVI